MSETTYYYRVEKSETKRKLFEEALRENEEKNRFLVESIEDSIYLIDKDYKYIFNNEKHLTRLGLSGKENIGRSFSEFHLPEETRLFIEKANKVFNTGDTIRDLYDDAFNGSNY